MIHNAACEVPQKMSVLQEEIRDLNNAISNLTDASEELIKRLKPVLRPEGPCEPDCCLKAIKEVPFQIEIHESTSKINRIYSTITSALNRLAL